jgi:hypothetical protein
LERKSEAWSNTECRPDRLLKCLDVCKLEQFEASRHRGRSRWESTSSGRLMYWKARHPDGITHRPDDWQETEFSDLQTVHNVLEHF